MSKKNSADRARNFAKRLISLLNEDDYMSMGFVLKGMILVIIIMGVIFALLMGAVDS